MICRQRLQTRMELYRTFWHAQVHHTVFIIDVTGKQFIEYAKEDVIRNLGYWGSQRL
jgi:hypothetical protein